MAARWVVLLTLGSTLSMFAQVTSSVAPQPSALTVTSAALSALTNGTPISDVTINATSLWNFGSDQESGTAILQARATGESLMQLNLSGGQRGEVRNNTLGAAAGQWWGPDGVHHDMALHNCWIDAVWFSPALAESLVQTNGRSAVFVAEETRQGATVEHLQATLALANVPTDFASVVAGLSAVDIYVTKTTSLPAAIAFSLHADDDYNRNIAVEVRFSDYRTVGNAVVPFRIQRVYQGTVVLDLTVTSAAINSGLPDSLFALQ